MAITPVVVSAAATDSFVTPIAGTVIKILPTKSAAVYTFFTSVQVNPITLVGQINPKR